MTKKRKIIYKHKGKSANSTKMMTTVIKQIILKLSMWFTEKLNGYGLTIRVKEKLYESKKLQRIEIYQTDFGKMLVIDGCIQFIEDFEKVYHEMLVHVPMFTHPNPKEILIIGGGDGGAAREAIKHNPDSVTVVEIDKNVVDACIKYTNIHNNIFTNERVKLKIEDGIKFVEKCAKNNKKFDVLIVDGTDPSPTSMPLFSKEFYEACSKISDVFCMQSQSPILQKSQIELIVNNLKSFKNKKMYVSCIPMYPGCLWSFLIASNKIDVQPDLENIKKKYNSLKINTYHYNPTIHVSAFTFPNWMAEFLKHLKL